MFLLSRDQRYTLPDKSGWKLVGGIHFFPPDHFASLCHGDRRSDPAWPIGN
jgi:hypothetical protein